MAIEVKKRPFYYNFSGNPVFYQLYSALAAADATVYFQYRVKYKTVGGVYAATKEFDYTPVNGIANIDIKDILDSVLEYQLPKFSGTEIDIWEAEKQTALFYLEFREITTVSTDPSWDVSEGYFQCFVVKGGINYFKYRGNNFWLNYFGSLTADPVPFLTWQQSGRLAAINERMYLAFLNDTSVAPDKIEAWVKGYFTDGTSAVMFRKVMDAVKGKIYYIPAGAGQWDLVAQVPLKTIHRWSIQVMDITLSEITPVQLSKEFVYEADNCNNNLHSKICMIN